MTADLIYFLILAFVSVGAALGLLFSRNAVYAALFLVLNFITVAIYYLFLNAPFLAMAQVTVYAGAIMVLFLFVIMLLGTKRLKTSGQNLWQRRLAIGLGVVLLSELVTMFFLQGRGSTLIGDIGSNFGSPEAIGLELFNQYLLPFEITSILLLVGMIGAIVLTKED
ncbi:MAG: NADH-quinone oxidoreductase subunit J [Anaerolineales bacterium]|nr:NADH-quinone oxidoreductase subunit J [Anaerolineales bacterium]